MRRENGRTEESLEMGWIARHPDRLGEIKRKRRGGR
jgi:hypothetical protein